MRSPLGIHTRLPHSAQVSDGLGQALLTIGLVLLTVFVLLFLLAWLEPPKADAVRRRRNTAPRARG